MFLFPREMYVIMNPLPGAGRVCGDWERILLVTKAFAC